VTYEVRSAFNTLLGSLTALGKTWIRDPEKHLMEYDGDNHGDTSEAAYNRALQSCYNELELILERFRK
jgi:hypothetical protein